MFRRFVYQKIVAVSIRHAKLVVVAWKRIELPVAVIVARCVSARCPRSVFARIVIVETAGELPELRR
jgi:hypothetical protein